MQEIHIHLAYKEDGSVYVPEQEILIKDNVDLKELPDLPEDYAYTILISPSSVAKFNDKVSCRYYGGKYTHLNLIDEHEAYVEREKEEDRRYGSYEDQVRREYNGGVL